MNEALTYDDVLLVPSYNHYESRKEVSIVSTDKSGKLTLDLPIMTANMDTISEHEMATFIGSKGGMAFLHRFMSIDENVAQYKKSPTKTVISIGTSEFEMERAKTLFEFGARYFCVDVAHAHAHYVGKTLKNLRTLLGKEVCLIAGNVATYAGADYLASCGADIIKVGIGGGSVCTTRIKTGFGVPNLTAIRECSKIDRSLIADGGIRTAGDIVKALAFGADFVMIGSMLSGTRPTPGAIIEKDGKKCKQYRGMASKEVMDDHRGGVAEWKTAEGVATYVPYREDEENIIADIIGGLRSGLTYAGSKDIKELQRKLNYVQVTTAGRIESLPHKIL